MSGLKSRRKGVRFELALVKLFQEHGFGAEKISGMYKPGPDLTVARLGRDRTIECKSRANGFASLYCWLENRDLLIVKADRKEPLCVVPWRLAVEVAVAAEKKKGDEA